MEQCQCVSRGGEVGERGYSGGRRWQRTWGCRDVVRSVSLSLPSSNRVPINFNLDTTTFMVPVDQQPFGRPPTLKTQDERCLMA